MARYVFKAAMRDGAAQGGYMKIVEAYDCVLFRPWLSTQGHKSQKPRASRLEPMSSGGWLMH